MSDDEDKSWKRLLWGVGVVVGALGLCGLYYVGYALWIVYNMPH